MPWFDALGLDEAVLVGHGWGDAHAFDRAARVAGTVLGLAFTETIVKPLVGDEFPAAGRPATTPRRTRPGELAAAINAWACARVQSLGSERPPA